MGYITSGNEIVDAMASVNISGSVIPTIWYQTIQKDNGKPYLLAISILADIVYWYRPTEIRDEMTGQILRWKKKFTEDLLQKSYQYYADLFGESKRTVKNAMDRLEELGVIKKEFRTITYKNGMISNNVMYVSLDPGILYQLTYPSEDYFDDRNEMEEPDIYQENTDFQEPIEKNGERVLKNSVPPIEKNGRRVLKNLVPPIEKNGRRVLKDLVPPVAENEERVLKKMVPAYEKNGGTNTKNTTKTTTENTIHPIISNHKVENTMDEMDMVQEAQAYRDYLWHSLECEIYTSEDTQEAEMYGELYELICDVVCVPRKSIRIEGESKPYEIVKSRFLKLTPSHLQYVILCVSQHTGKINNIKAYLLAALYNAPSTMDAYYAQRVKSDMAGNT